MLSGLQRFFFFSCFKWEINTIRLLTQRSLSGITRFCVALLPRLAYLHYSSRMQLFDLCSFYLRGRARAKRGPISWFTLEMPEMTGNRPWPKLEAKSPGFLHERQGLSTGWPWPPPGRCPLAGRWRGKSSRIFNTGLLTWLGSIWTDILMAKLNTHP